MARRTAVTLIGSYVAFRTNTGSCMSEARRIESGLRGLLPAGDSELGAMARPASEVWPPRESPDMCRFDPIALPQAIILPLYRAWQRISCGPCHGKREDRTGASFAQHFGTRVQRRSGRHYIIYQ